MKKFRDDDLFDELANRLDQYSENPDDTLWDGIAVAIKQESSLSWYSRMGYAATIAVTLGLASWLLLRDKVGAPKEIATFSQTKNASVSARSGQTARQQQVVHSTYKNSGVTATTPGSDAGNTKGGNGSAITPPDKEAKGIIANVEPRETNDLASTVTTSPDLAVVGAVDKPDSFAVAQIPARLVIDSAKAENPVPVIINPGKKAGISVYVLVNPSLSYQRVIPNPNDNILVDKFSSAPMVSAKRFGFSFEAGIQGTLSRRLQYYGGLSYYQQNQTLEYHEDPAESIATASTSIPDGATKQFEYDMKNLGVQAGVLYTLGDGKLTSQVGAGLSYQHGFLKAGRTPAIPMPNRSM